MTPIVLDTGPGLHEEVQGTLAHPDASVPVGLDVTNDNGLAGWPPGRQLKDFLVAPAEVVCRASALWWKGVVGPGGASRAGIGRWSECRMARTGDEVVISSRGHSKGAIME